MSGRSKKYESQIKTKESHHYFFLNPYEDMAFTRCPKCEEKTKIRKHCLVIHVEPKLLASINKSCRYCSKCDLIIVKQTDLEKLLVEICEQNAPGIIGNEYLVFGTMDRKDWKNALTGKISQQEAIKRTYPFNTDFRQPFIFHKKTTFSHQNI